MCAGVLANSRPSVFTYVMGFMEYVTSWFVWIEVDHVCCYMMFLNNTQLHSRTMTRSKTFWNVIITSGDHFLTMLLYEPDSGKFQIPDIS